MTVPPTDFSPLEPDDPAHWERLARRIEAAAAPELAARARRAATPAVSWGQVLVLWRRPLLAAAAALVLLAGGALAVPAAQRERDPQAEALALLVEVPYESAALITRGE